MLHCLADAPTFEKILLPHSWDRSRFLCRVTGQLWGYTL